MEKLVKQIMTIPKPPKWSWPKDWLAKAISMLFAVFLWYFVSGEDRVDMSVQIPVEIVNLPRNLIISNQFKSQLNVTVSGPRAMIRGIDRQHVTRSIDLSSAKPGNMVVQNELDSISFPRGIKTLRIQPSSVTFFLDQLIQKEIPVEHVLAGKISNNFELISLTLEPSALSVSGPAAILNDVEVLKTKPIDISEIKTSTLKQVQLDVSEDLANLTGDPIVTANFKLKAKVAEKEVSNVPIQVDGIPEGFYANPTPAYATISITLPASLEKETKNLHSLLSATIDATNLVPGTYDLKIKANAAEKVTVTNLNPENVQVEIWEKKSKKKFN